MIVQSINQSENQSINCRDFEGCHQLLNLDLAHNQIAIISGAFHGLQNLNKINLIGNDIACIDREALESLTNVEEIEIDLRYLQCSCGNDWVRYWIFVWINSNGKSKGSHHLKKNCIL